MAYVLWKDFMTVDPKSPKWFNRDRFVLSAGHGSMLNYSLLHLMGFDLTVSTWGGAAGEAGLPWPVCCTGTEQGSGPGMRAHLGAVRAHASAAAPRSFHPAPSSLSLPSLLPPLPTRLMT